MAQTRMIMLRCMLAGHFVLSCVLAALLPTVSTYSARTIFGFALLNLFANLWAMQHFYEALDKRIMRS